MGSKRSVLSSWHKAYQKRTLSIDSELPEDNYHRAIGISTSEATYPLALRPDPTINPHSHLSSIVETCDTAGYLELLNNPHANLIEKNEKDSAMQINPHTIVYIPTNTLTISSVFLAALIIILIWYFKQKQTKYLRQESVITESSISTNITPPSTPDYYQLEQPLTPPFQSRYEFEKIVWKEMVRGFV
jgi:hypothetical protein